MKLNKNGWALDIEIFYIIIFVLCLIIAIIGIIRMDLLMGRDKIDVQGTDSFNYTSLETKLKDAAEEFLNDKSVLSSEELVTVSALKRSDYLEEFKDGNGESCDGYVEAKISETIEYKTYISCYNYKTEGYDSKKVK